MLSKFNLSLDVIVKSLKGTVSDGGSARLASINNITKLITAHYSYFS